MPLTKGAVVDFLAKLSEEAAQDLLQRAKDKRGVLIDDLIYIRCAAHSPDGNERSNRWRWSHSLRTVRCHLQKLEGLLRASDTRADSPLHRIIQLEQLCPPGTPEGRQSLSLLDAAILSGEANLAKRLFLLNVPQVLQFFDIDFFHTWRVQAAQRAAMDDEGARRVAAALSSKLPLNAIADFCQHGYQVMLEYALLGGHKSTAGLLRWAGASLPSSSTIGRYALRVQWGQKEPAHWFLDQRFLELSHAMGVSLQASTVQLWGGIRHAFRCQRRGKRRSERR